MRYALVLLLFLVACGEKEKPTPSPPQPEPDLSTYCIYHEDGNLITKARASWLTIREGTNDMCVYFKEGPIGNAGPSIGVYCYTTERLSIIVVKCEEEATPLRGMAPPEDLQP